MSINHIQNKISMKKIKLDESDENVSSILKYKRLAFLKFNNENGKRNFQFNKLFITDDIHALVIFCCFKFI